MNRLLICGAGGHAKAVADVVLRQGEYEIAGFLDENHPERAGTSYCGAPIIVSADAARVLLDEGVSHAHIAVGESRARLRLAERAREWGFALARVIHPTSSIGRDASIGAGSFVGAGTILGAEARLGENVILNDASGLGHDAVLEDGVSVGPRVWIAGAARIGRGAWVAMGAAVREGVCVGRGAVIGAGALVLRDVPERVVVFGLPGKAVRELPPEDTLL
jgi:sugar O-acyltransferase (sialic acid O-acetyltransferase NeuD family)